MRVLTKEDYREWKRTYPEGEIVEIAPSPDDPFDQQNHRFAVRIKDVWYQHKTWIEPSIDKDNAEKIRQKGIKAIQRVIDLGWSMMDDDTMRLKCAYCGREIDYHAYESGIPLFDMPCRCRVLSQHERTEPSPHGSAADDLQRPH